MKRSYSVALILSNLILLGFVLVATLDDNNPEINTPGNDSTVAQKVLAVSLPNNPNFAGEPIPVEDFDVHERLDRELLVNTYWHSNSLQLFKLSKRAFPVIEPILKAEGVPTDFKYLALAESGLRHVVSPARAEGIWQFMKSTAKEYDLEVTTEVDERYHLEKSTKAACQYLKKRKRRAR